MNLPSFVALRLLPLSVVLALPFFGARLGTKAGFPPSPSIMTPAWVDRRPASIVSASAVDSPKSEARRARLLERATRVRPVASVSAEALREGERVSLPLFDGRVAGGVVRLVGPREDGGSLIGGRLDDGGTFSLSYAAGGRAAEDGLISPRGDGPVYRLLEADDGGALLAELPRSAVLCATLPRPPSARSAFAAPSATTGAVILAAVETPLLDSRPDAEPVLYLDFDGQTVTDPVWNGGQPIEAAPSGLSAEEIRRAWAMVAEDYRPFRINVTTNPARYAAARPMQRMRCIITPTRDWYGEVGGVALVFSWRDAGASIFAPDVPCWIFSEPGVMTAEDVALAASHEAGHTLGLYHDGLRGEDGVTPPEGDYYQGHGSGATAWGPIMGAPYGKPLIQWSRGDYAVGLRVANNPQDDVALIATIENHVGFAPERRAETLADACRLSVAADGMTVDHRGLIERAGAEAWMIFATGAGALNLALAPDDPAAPLATNFDGALTLTTTAGVVVATADQSGTCFPRLDATVPAGVYVLRVKSVGEGSPTAGGYSNYGSIGRYRVVGSIRPASGVAPLLGGAPRGEGRAGEAFSYAIEAAGAGLAYAAENLPPGLSVAGGGEIIGTPSATGLWRANLHATNSAGTSSRDVTFAIAGAGLAESLNAPALAVATGGSRPWLSVADANSLAGGSCVRSGELLDDNGESWIETTVTGPGRLRWAWRVSSEKDYDLFHVAVDGSVAAAISGEVDWTERTLEIGAGSHVIRWSYDKDDYLSEHEDAAWLDAVRWERGFEQWAAAAALSDADATPDADPDRDGAANLLEYAAGRDPRLPDGLGDAVRVQAVSAASGGGSGPDTRLEIVFVRPANRADLRYVVEVSADLVTWARGHAYGSGADNSASVLPTLEMERVVLADGAERVRVRDASSASEASPRRFIRLRIERP